MSNRFRDASPSGQMSPSWSGGITQSDAAGRLVARGRAPWAPAWAPDRAWARPVTNLAGGGVPGRGSGGLAAAVGFSGGGGFPYYYFYRVEQIEEKMPGTK